MLRTRPMPGEPERLRPGPGADPAELRRVLLVPRRQRPRLRQRERHHGRRPPRGDRVHEQFRRGGAVTRRSCAVRRPVTVTEWVVSFRHGIAGERPTAAPPRRGRCQGPGRRSPVLRVGAAATPAADSAAAGARSRRGGLASAVRVSVRFGPAMAAGPAQARSARALRSSGSACAGEDRDRTTLPQELHPPGGAQAAGTASPIRCRSASRAVEPDEEAIRGWVKETWPQVEAPRRCSGPGRLRGRGGLLDDAAARLHRARRGSTPVIRVRGRTLRRLRRRPAGRRSLRRRHVRRVPPEVGSYLRRRQEGDSHHSAADARRGCSTIRR